jgi:hypothetical protein
MTSPRHDTVPQRPGRILGNLWENDRVRLGNGSQSRGLGERKTGGTLR